MTYMASPYQKAIWCCPRCGRTAMLCIPTYYSITRWCNHWIAANHVERVRMTAINDTAKMFDEWEKKLQKETSARHERERAITAERADWRFGCVS